ncbi:MAG: iron-containing alcohol dehydrogenase [Planctomycetota bacterium]|jgi:alcohol dehydrogenase YqhD (iron-dependent ADH family)|nr:iron-containing alcohol dehydrogenase [Planctomycetota bacterium]
MLDFTFLVPTKVIFGKDAERRVGDEIRSHGFKKVLVHFGGESARKSGLLDRVRKSLADAGIESMELGGVKPNPRLSLVREGIELCEKNGVDFLLAVGGGSVIDSAKAIGLGLANDGDVWDFFEGVRRARACAPVGCILTIAAAGSETSCSAVVTNEDGWKKMAVDDELIRPRFAILNPELTFTLPDYQSMCGVVDILMHTMERYFSKTKNTDLIDRIAEGLLTSVMENGAKIHENPADYDARAEIMWGGSLAHNGLTGAGRAGDWSTHQLEHELSGMWDVAHGAGLAVIWPSWARFVRKEDVARFAQFAVRVMGCRMNFENPGETALAGIDAMERYFKSIAMPTTMKDLGVGDVTDAEIAEMVEKCSRGGRRKLGSMKALDRPEMKKIYEMAR